jgi:hypothetical protein
MPNLRSDGKPRSAPVGRVKAATRASGSAPALALTRPAGADHTSISRSPLTHKTVAEEPGEACVSKDEGAHEAPSPTHPEFIEGRDGLSGLSPVARFHCVRFAKRFARNGTSGFLSLRVRA